MKAIAFLSAVLTLAATAEAAKAGYAAVAKKIDKQSFLLKAGVYRFVNAKSGHGLTYSSDGQQIYAVGGKGSWMTVSTHHKHAVISPSQSNRKCLSAAWSYSTGNDNTGALYACTAPVQHKGKRDVITEPVERSVQFNFIDFENPNSFLTEDDIRNATIAKRGLNTDKQYFYIHPEPSVKDAYHVVAYDHITNMPTRALGDGSQHPKWAKKGIKMANLVALNNKDKSQLWYIYNKNGKRI